MMLNRKKTKIIVNAALIAAIYTVLTLLSSFLGLSGNNPIQLRISEAMCVLPVFMSEAIPGLTVGCIISNLITGCALWDIVFGSFATFLGALLTYIFRKNRYAASLFPILTNTVIVSPVLYFVYGGTPFPYLVLCVFVGEFICCGIFGQILYSNISRFFRR